MGQPALLELRGIGKTYGSVQASKNVNLSLFAGEIHALLGENGAGKSTLVKVLCGMLRPDTGEVCWQGEGIDLSSPAAAQQLGIGVVFQNFSIFRALTVAENIALGLPGVPRKELEQKMDEVSEHYGFALEPDRHMYTLSVGEWQRVEIARCLLGEPRLLVLDEPTSVLTPQEAELLFAVLRKLADEGCAVLYISHRLGEIRGLCHKATIMRAGEVIAECDPQEETPQSLAQLMIGRKPKLPQRPARRPENIQASLVLQDLCLDSLSPFGPSLKNINLTIEGGGITAIAGIAGNGQQELGAVLAGEQLVTDSWVRFNEQPIGDLAPQTRRDLGLHYVPEERLGHGAAPDLSLWENTCLTARNMERMVKFGFLLQKTAVNFTQHVIDKYEVRCAGPFAQARSLSGGNLQKFIVGRELSQAPRALVVMQPTWGVDAGSAASIHQALLDLAATGVAVLVISQDLAEIFILADQVAVISDGQLSPAMPVAQLTSEKIGMLMGGVHKEANVAA